MMNYEIHNRTIMKMDYSHLVALPRIWLERHNIGKGDKVDMELLPDGALLLRPSRNNDIQNEA